MNDDNTSSSSSSTTLETLRPRPLKRKRTDNGASDDKRVRFDDQIQVIATYSSEEYDRGGIFSFPVLYKVNPSILQQQQQAPSPPKLSLDTQLHPLPSSDEKQTSPHTPLEDSPTTPPPTMKQRPKLTINTSNLTDGPAFLTRLSTTHATEDKTNDYLVPLSAYAPPSFLPFF